MNDVPLSIFSPSSFSTTLGRQRPPGSQQSAADIVAALGWDPPGSPDDLADRWVKELDRAGVARAALIASVPGRRGIGRAGGCAASVAVRRILHARSDGAGCGVAHRARARRGSASACICLFPAMQRYSLHDPRVREIVQLAAAHAGTAVFVHCGALSVGVRKKLGLPSRFDVRYRQSPRPSRARRRPSRRAVHHPALRRRAFPRSVAGRRSLPERVPRHVEHEPVDVVSPWAWRWPTSSGRRSILPGRTGCCSAQTPRFFRAGGTGGLRRAGKRARGRGRRRKGPPANFHGQFRPIVSRLEPALPGGAILFGATTRWVLSFQRGRTACLTNRCPRRPIGADEHHPRNPKALAPEACRARRRVRRRRLSPHAAALGVRARDAQIQPRLDHRVPRRDGDDFRRARRLLLRAAAMAARQRRTGRAVSGRVRADARNRHPERARSGKRIVVAFAGACPPPGRTGDRALRRHRARPAARGTAAAPLCGRYRRHHRGGVSPLRARPGVSAAGRVGAAADGRRRARSQPVPHQREARQHDRAARVRSGHRRDRAGLRVGQGRAAHPQIDQRAVRAHADGLQQRHEDLRRDAVRSAGLDRLLRRVGRREVGRVHDARGRSAVREAARDGIRVPGLHGARAAQD